MVFETSYMVLELLESKTAQKLFEQKLAIMAASVSTSHGSGDPSHNIVRCSSFDSTNNANTCPPSEGVPAQSTKDLFLDISDVTSLSSISISSSEVRSFEELTRRTSHNPRLAADW